MAEVKSAIAMMRKARFIGNFASAAECEMDSKPTYAHGARAKMVNVPPRAVCSGAKAGLMAGASGRITAAIKQITTPKSSKMAAVTWTR